MHAVFVEKILRVQPDIKKLYLLIRSLNTCLATQRLHVEVRHSNSYLIILFEAIVV